MAATESGPEFSVVISCLNEEATVGEFLARVHAAMLPLQRSFEIVAVDDGSSDATFRVLTSEMAKVPSLTKIVRFYRNSGQAAGVTAAICGARGRNFVMMDSDLQLRPEELPMLLAEFDQGYDVVTGYRAQRMDPLRRRFMSGIANFALRQAAGVRVRDFGCTFKIYRGSLLRAFDLGPHNTIRQTRVLAMAGSIREVAVTHLPRKVGRSGWTFPKLLSFLIDNLIGATGRIFQKIAFAALSIALLLVLRMVLGIWFEGRFIGEVSQGLILNALFFWSLVIVGLICLVGEFNSQLFRRLGGTPAYVIKEVCERCS